jgi:hypothetical protein
MATTYTQIATHTTTGTVSSYTFSNIPSTYTDAVIVINDMGADTSYKINLNGDTGSNYSSTFMYGESSSAVSGRGSSATAAPTVGRRPGNTIMQFQNYSNTTTNKTFITRGNASNHMVIATVSLYRSTSAVSSITITPETGSFGSGVTFNLYGIAAASAPIAKATGGTITTLSGYTVHTFTDTGTFTPSANLEVEYLVVAGGGGGYFNGAAGGGAGGFRTNVGGSLLACSSGTAYTVTVGAGGSTNTDGSGSSFNGINASGGGGASGGGSLGGPGGSGAGGRHSLGAGGAGNIGGYFPVEGYAGGRGGNDNGGGGGGGAGAVGTDASGGAGGAGGIGRVSLISGTSTYYAGGGGGSTGTAGGNGGLGGGGNGRVGSGAGGNGTANTGGGAGGSREGSGGTGGSGIVIVRYRN